MFTSPFLFFFCIMPTVFPCFVQHNLTLWDWIGKMNTQDIALWYFAMKLLLWMGRGGGGRYWIPLKASSIISLEMKILRKSQRKEDWRGYESFISLNVQQVSPPLPFVTTIRTAPSDVDTVSVAQKRSDAYISDLWHFSHICNTCPVFVMCSICYFKM